MKLIALASSSPSARTAWIKEILKDEYEFRETHSLDETLVLLEDSFEALALLIFDFPKSTPWYQDVAAYIRSRNNYMFSVPVMVLTDPEHMEGDDECLGDPAAGLICSTDSKKTVQTHCNSAITLANSRSFEDFSRMLTALPSLVYVKDEEGRYAFCSKQWHHTTGSLSEYRGKTDFDIRKDKANAEIARKSDLEVLKSGVGQNYIIKEEDAEEGIDYLQVIKEPLRDKKGNVNGIIAIINNVTSEEKLRQELRFKSITDPLTGVFNRCYFEELNAAKDGTLSLPFSVISADCDGLKQINDQFGHAAGDEYICAAKDVMQSVLPAGSYVFRMGGDEFLAVIPNAGKAEAASFVEKILAKAKEVENENFRLEVSLGAYTVEKEGYEMEDVLRISDKAMYRMKETHRREKGE